MTSHRPSEEIFIDNKKISKNDPVYFIAEIGSNFDQDLERAKDLIYLAKEAGADAAKFQHYTANSLVSDFGFKNLKGSKSHQDSWDKSVYDTYDDASLNADWTAILQETCKEAGITFFTSPYAFDLVDQVDPYVPAFKIGSGDITWIEIIKHIASKNKPVLIATGASDIVDVKRAVDATLELNSDIVLMQCNTNYTAKSINFSNLHLNVLRSFQELYPGIITGLSDHMPGNTAVLGAVVLGARVIEKHFTDSTERDGPDHPFSMTPETWREMVDRSRELEASLGQSIKRIEDNEKETVIVQRRSICSSRDLKEGAVIQKDDLTMLRPCEADAIEPYEEENVIGKTLKRDIESGEYLKWSDLT
ncbi:MAG: N-acetylneuraminate synthase [Bacteroidetes bacterium]|nr:MAG: N-acetylneuraminate synthase [Bacteroidota bacterium]